MHSLRSILSSLACLVLTAIGSGNAVARGLAESAPEGVDLSGDWKRNASMSDDVDKIMAERRAMAHEQNERERLRYRRQHSQEGDFYEPPPPPRPLPRRVPVAQQVTVEQEGKHFRVRTVAPDGDTDSDDYIAGGKSIVSFGSGVADRTCGWSGRVFIVNLRAADENSRKAVRYSLDTNGRLIILTTVSGGGLPAYEFKSLYDRIKMDTAR